MLSFLHPTLLLLTTAAILWADMSDEDYDDIRLVVACPKFKAAGDRIVRIVK